MSTDTKYKVYGIKVTVGQEKNVATIILNRLTESSNVASVFVLPAVRGYVFVETKERDVIAPLVQGIKHVKSRPLMAISLEELMQHLTERPVIDVIEPGEEIEIVAGPLKGMMGKVIRVDKLKKEVTIELKESAYTLPISVPSNHIRPASKTAR
ncbi:MAG: transcription elongation factor Spt5 [Aigarchaeota archaeon]|nr:transcription elongation factor Spt5 [Aigarchaeota archaeon]MDW8093005.1 transcription elongation factor Spt5 [Nitrososphaerota archaeon]